MFLGVWFWVRSQHLSHISLDQVNSIRIWIRIKIWKHNFETNWSNWNFFILKVKKNPQFKSIQNNFQLCNGRVCVAEHDRLQLRLCGRKLLRQPNHLLHSHLLSRPLLLNAPLGEVRIGFLNVRYILQTLKASYINIGWTIFYQIHFK